MKDYRKLSMWHNTVLGDDYTPRAALPGDIDADVCVIGAGYTGLWTAYYLKKADPSLRIAIVEKEIAGFGASGLRGLGAQRGVGVSVLRDCRSQAGESRLTGRRDRAPEGDAQHGR